MNQLKRRVRGKVRLFSAHGRTVDVHLSKESILLRGFTRLNAFCYEKFTHFSLSLNE